MLLESNFLSISLLLFFLLFILFVSVLSLPHLQETAVQTPPLILTEEALLALAAA